MSRVMKALAQVPPHRLAWLERALGLVFVGTSMAMTAHYMTLLDKFVQNDYYWTQFNASGAQTFVADAFNAQLWNTSSSATLGLFTGEIAMEKDYSTSDTTIDVVASDARRTAMEQLRNVPAAIAGLRAQSTIQTMNAITHYCFVDFDQAWETAHTAARQARCKARYATNGVVYMEAMLRNTDWTAWHSMWGAQFQVAFGSAIAESPGGAAWLARTTTALSTMSIDAEGSYWTAHDITTFMLPWHNRHLNGFDNAILVQNALQSFSIPLHHVQFARRGAAWTSVIAAMCTYNDMGYCTEVGVSLVRNASNSFTTLDPMGPYITMGTDWGRLYIDQISPIFAGDLFYVEPPAPTVVAFKAIQAAWFQAVQFNPQLGNAYAATASTATFQMVPPAWTAISPLEYHGGNPLCYTGAARSYVQQPFGFDDACTEPQPPFTIDGSTKTIMLALALQMAGSTTITQPFQAQIDAICALNVPAVATCQAALAAAASLWTTWSSLPGYPTTVAVMSDLLALEIGFMQYAKLNATTPTMLHQPLLDIHDPVWSFYGWLHVVEWLEGTREVVSFEGDAHIFALMSKAYPAGVFAADQLSIPNRFSYFVWLLMLYMCIVSATVLLVALAYAVWTRGSFCGRNLAFFSPVVGIVWMGRPLLFVRGVTAIVMLSTANIQLVHVHGFTRFEVATRSFLDALIVSGETLWLTFAINDVLSVATTKYAHLSTVASAVFVWLVSLILELADPFQPTATVHRTCTSSNLDAQLSCNSGVVQVGSARRFRDLVIVQFVCVLVGYVVARAVVRINENPIPVILPAVAAHLLVAEGTDGLYYDKVTSVLCGLLPLRLWDATTYVFSIVLWICVPVNQDIFRNPSSCRTSITIHPFGVPDIAVVDPAAAAKKRMGQKLRALAAVGFLIASAVSSALFFYVLKDQLSNDFLWQGFNSTGLQPFLVDWYNTELNYNPAESTLLQLNQGAMARYYNGTSASVAVSTFYAATMQFETLSLLATVRGLRNTDPCALPWVATQYCWVDFARQWSMANTAARQSRCQLMQANGAVYLEAWFGNTDWTALTKCWGPALDHGILDYIGHAVGGPEWLAGIHNQRTPNDEVAYWKAHHITTYVVQWQNYKSLGVVETVDVQSAMGLKSPLTLKASTGAYRFAFQTSMPMYWGLASDLGVVAHNSSLSLVGNSPSFLFANVSMEALLVQQQYISMPLDAGLALVRAAIGPFGSIDLVHMACPPTLLQLVHAFATVDTATLLATPAAQTPLASTSQQIPLVPTAWLQNYAVSRGGSILCPANAASRPLQQNGLCTWFSATSSCGSIFSENLYPTRAHSVVALIASGAYQPCATCPTLAQICAKTTTPPEPCLQDFLPVQSWITSYMPASAIQTLVQDAAAIQTTLRALAIEVVQYAQVNATSAVELLRMNVLAPADPYFQLFGWYLLVEWATGVREVVSMQGDGGTINTLSTYLQPSSSVPNPLEIPQNLVYYCQLCIEYTTAVVFIITFFSLAYTVASHGYIEGLNMAEINRVGGIVWVGRPLLFLRSLVAILILSTAKVTIEMTGGFTTIQTPHPTGIQWLSTLLAGSETCWLVIVLTDLGLVITKDHSNTYSLKSSIVGTIVSIVLSVASPVTPTFELARTCDATHMDLQLTCRAGVIQIGSATRTIQLAYATAIVVVVCFVVERLRCPNLKLPPHNLSLLMPAGAHYLYEKGPWIFDGTLYLDKASAFVCGLIAISHNQSVYLLDIKTWRTHAIAVDGGAVKVLSTDKYDQKRIQASVPLVE
ncbi:Aste57867_9862 [Aphanomyces stellatus]|uniref:Aste57867_9862 protein n=1 Tax=Aphanomyces stellatus TaxID=120398 RepID=A0A485KNX8_9STRA|nr:hypothetical protein As57867_009823 [Aphanomyces stellatus]VFT86741.1 Aste57867_9862 [Aphanomyces stellatus]